MKILTKNGLLYLWNRISDVFAKKADLSEVANSGKYDDLIEKPDVATWNEDNTDISGTEEQIDADLLGGYPPSHYTTLIDDVNGNVYMLGVENGVLYFKLKE